MHSEHPTVFPLAPWPLLKQCVCNRNDTERKAGERFILDLCR